MEIQFILQYGANLWDLWCPNWSDGIGRCVPICKPVKSIDKSMHCLLQLWILGMTSSAQTDWFPLIWSHISPPTIPRRNSHTCSQAINCLPSPVKFSCLRGNDAGRNVWDRRSRWQVATDRQIVAAKRNDCCRVCNKQSSYSSSSFPVWSVQRFV